MRRSKARRRAVGASGLFRDRGQVVEVAALRHELPEVVVGEAEEGRAEGGEDGQAVGGVVDGAEDVGEGTHLVAREVLLAADEAVRDALGGEGRLVVADELRGHAPHEEADVARARRADGASPSQMLHGAAVA